MNSSKETKPCCFFVIVIHKHMPFSYIRIKVAFFATALILFLFYYVTLINRTGLDCAADKGRNTMR